MASRVGSNAMQRKQVALRCRINRGAFSDELVFEVEQSDSGKPYIGAASRIYFWHSDGTPVGSVQPAEDETVDGLVAARLLTTNNRGVLVAIPDGEVVAVNRGLVAPRPPEATAPDVSLESRLALGD